MLGIRPTGETPPTSHILEDDSSKKDKEFIPPKRAPESPIVISFLEYFPDVTKLTKLPFLKNTGFCQCISKNIDTIGIIVVIYSIAITIIAAFGVFYSTFLVIKVTFFAIECISGIVAILSTGGYVKKYFLLRRIQEEMKILNAYSSELDKHITSLEKRNTELQQTVESLKKAIGEYEGQNKAFTQSNVELKKSLTESQSQRTQLEVSLSKLQSQLQDLTKTNTQLQKTSMALQNNVTTFEQQNTTLTSNNTQLKASIQTLEGLLQTVKTEFEGLKNATPQLATLYKMVKEYKIILQNIKNEVKELSTQRDRTKTLLNQHLEKLTSVSQFLTQKKGEIETATQQLKTVTSNLQKAANSPTQR